MNLIECKSILGIKTRITEIELKSIYKKKALELHPDINKSPTAVDDFRKLKEAYEFLLGNLNKLPLDNKYPVIYRILTKDHIQSVKIPIGALKEDGLTIHFKWHEQEYRIHLKKGTELPHNIKVDGIALILKIKEESYYE